MNRDWQPIDDDPKIELELLLQLADAIESLLLNSDYDQAIQDVQFKVMKLHENEFPEGEIRSQFLSLRDAIYEASQRVESELNREQIPRLVNPAFSHRANSLLPSRTKHSIKKKTWELFRNCMSLGQR